MSLFGIIFIYYVIAINIVTFFVYGYDKRQARKKRQRVSERTLMLLAVAMGATGALAGMYVFRHKTLHKKFTLGVPALLVLNAAVAVFFAFKGWL